MAVPVRYTFLCRPLQNDNQKWPSSALSWESEPRRLIIAVSQIQFRESFDGDKQSKLLQNTLRFVGKI